MPAKAGKSKQLSSRKKFFNKKTQYRGVTYDSKLEARWAAEFWRQKEAGELLKIERQVPLELRVNNILVCKMIVDFRLTYADGHVEWTEVKGIETPVWRLKKRLLEALFPDLTYTVVRRMGE